MLDLCCSLQGLHYQVAYTGNYPTLLALAARGEVLTLSALVSAAHAVRAGELVAVPVSEPQWRQRSLQVLTLQGQTPSTPVIGFRDYLIEMALKRGQARDGTARKRNEQV
ncbi:MAG: LysR substrate-binding domain-containing protein [Anaerolineales bacterium]